MRDSKLSYQQRALAIYLMQTNRVARERVKEP